jgi:hypothetical protein
MLPHPEPEPAPIEFAPTSARAPPCDCVGLKKIVISSPNVYLISYTHQKGLRTKPSLHGKMLRKLPTEEEHCLPQCLQSDMC